MTKIQGPTLGAPPPVVGLPGALKDSPRADIRPEEFIKLIEFGGMRVLWSRAGMCPCQSVNGQTKQVDPRCPLCKGNGWFYFGPAEYAVPAEAGVLNPLQEALRQKHDAVVIRGIMASLSVNQDAYEPLGNWVWGSSMITVRPENRLGYYDRITHVDSVMAYSEVVVAGAPTAPLALRYPATAVNIIRSTTTRYDQDTDFLLDSTGEITWRTGRAPKAGTRIAAHYLCHPQWIVIEVPKILRETTIRFKRKDLTGPMGDPVPLPIQALVRLEHLLT